MTRRDFGNVRRLRSGRWQVRYYTTDGRRHNAPTTFTTKADANAYLDDMQVDIRRGKWIDPALGQQPAGPWLEKYVTSLSHLKPKTKLSYESLLRCWILPTFERTPIGSIRPSSVRNWVADMSKRGLSASRVRQSYNIFTAAMKAAVLDGLIPSHPCVGVKLPRLPQGSLRYLTASQVHQLCQSMPSPFDLFVDILAFGGLRFGEAAALRRSCCSQRNVLHVRESLAEVNGALIFGAPKDHQIRTVDIPSSLSQAIATYMSSHVAPYPDALLFTAPEGGPLQYSNFMDRIWRPAIINAKLDATPHLLRHTCASLLLDAGASVRDLQAHLGHADPQITLKTYSALIEGRSADLARHLDQLWVTTKGTQRAHDEDAGESK